MTKRELLRQINAICQELREVSRNSENPEELYDLNTMVENVKDQVEEDNKGMETQISEKLRELGINLGQSQMDTLATVFAVQMEMGTKSNVLMRDINQETARKLGIKPNSINTLWSRTLDSLSLENYKKTKQFCGGQSPTLKKMARAMAASFAM